MRQLKKMFKSLITAVAFTKNLRTTGAFYETSKYVVNKISKFVLNTHAQTIIEYGAGHGNITRGILFKMHPNSRLYAFEINKQFCETLKEIEDDRLIIINASANDVDQHLLESNSVDCIVSSLPFTFITNNDKKQILAKSHNLLKKGHHMTQVLYSSMHLKFFSLFFVECKSNITMNFPPAYIYECRK